MLRQNPTIRGGKRYLAKRFDSMEPLMDAYPLAGRSTGCFVVQFSVRKTNDLDGAVPSEVVNFETPPLSEVLTLHHAPRSRVESRTANFHP